MKNSSAEAISSWSIDDLEKVFCPLCGSKPGVKIRYSFPPFKIVACRKCSLVFLSPRLTERNILELYQEEAYYQSAVPGQGYDEYLEVRKNWLKTFKRRLNELQKIKPAGRVLDVGCGPGFFMEVAAQMGYDVWGLDPSTFIVRMAQNKFGDRVIESTLETSGFDKQSFDLLVASDTFEHIYNPLKFLNTAHELLAPNGILMITTPNATSALARVSGRHWVSFKIPEHVFYWTPTTITAAIKDKFEILKIQRAGQYATLGFLARRLFGTGSEPTRLKKSIISMLNSISVYANNGSITVMAIKK